MKQRLISALVVLILFIPILILGGIYFRIGITFISMASVYEIVKFKDNIPKFIKLLSYSLIIFMIFTNINYIIKIFIVFLILLTPLIFYDRKNYNIEIFSFLSSFIVFLGLVFSYVCKIRDTDINILIFLLLITILTDTFAYVGGKLFGKHKLIEKVSPGKTIEGSVIGSLVGTVLPTIYYIYMINPSANILSTILMIFVLSLIGQLGDLVFSSIKRFYKVKDFSNIIPGHGGILDRLDSIIFVTMGYLVLINFI
ncbi:MAG: phosphatidate cytidylyltransferase [Bacilli bacterium]|nr:phosphatidate cytidylyltransferase [Bacilli bacterium]